MNNIIKSPFNYIGGKTKLMPILMELFPKNINTFVEPFCGGYNVGINVDAKKIIEIDINSYLIGLISFIKQTDNNILLSSINDLISKYDLSLDNEAGYKKLRDDYNVNKNPLELFVLICFCFNHQIRFNNKFLFNTPFGKQRSSYNKTIEKNLIEFSNKVKQQNVTFIEGDFLNFDYESLGKDDFVYCDPPYFITTGSYNDGTRGFGDWTIECENRLLKLLDKLNDKGVKFALSNVFIHKGLKNDLLIEWSKKYIVNFVDKNYKNSNYHSTAKDYDTIEVVVTNYESR